MDMFGRLGDILRSYLHGEEDFLYRRDFEEAWEELNQFLLHPDEPIRGKPRAEPLRGYTWAGSSYRMHWPDPQEHLRQDYANLELPFRSDLETVKKQYKTLLRKYHPDQYAQDPEKYRYATEVTKKLNESFHRIKEYHQHRS